MIKMYPNNQPYNYDLKKLAAMKKLKELQSKFDKDYIEEMFEAMGDSGIDDRNQNMVYEHNGWIYLLRREPDPRRMIV